jgi:hypothetical protein
MALGSGEGRPQQCRAHSKRSKKRCRKFALAGCKNCANHGGWSEDAPAYHSINVASPNSRYIAVEDLEEIQQAARELRTQEGRAKAIAVRVAVLKSRLKHVPGDVEHLPLATGVSEKITKSIESLHEIEKDVAAPVEAVTYVVANFDPAKQAPFLARGTDGPCTVRLLDDAPFMLDPVTGGWMPCSKQTDDESGAVYFTREDRLLETH